MRNEDIPTTFWRVTCLQCPLPRGECCHIQGGQREEWDFITCEDAMNVKGSCFISIQ